LLLLRWQDLQPRNTGSRTPSTPTPKPALAQATRPEIHIPRMRITLAGAPGGPEADGTIATTGIVCVKAICATTERNSSWSKRYERPAENHNARLPVLAQRGYQRHQSRSALAQTLLKKSFLADERNSSGPLMRSVRRDVRDHIRESYFAPTC
jgi:hypothetical protein